MNALIVTVSDGKLQGKTCKNIEGQTIYSYEGIPYGQPPVGELRFKAPKPALPWTGVRDATKKGDPCFAVEIDLDKLKDVALGKIETKIENNKIPFQGSEDCLNLNVYTSDVSSGSSKPKPVMVWIHGGGFIMGDTKYYGPEILLTQDIVLVTVHYRLGALGFLTLDDDPKLEIPGNAGLKDMVLALQWVQKNIKVFNGDPNNVTIFGQSAGGASVHYLMLSPLTKGLFHRVIAQSGTAVSFWSKGNPNNAKELAKVLGCTSTNKKELLTFLQTLPIEKLAEGQALLEDFLNVSKLRPFSPIIEKPSPTAFVSEDPIKIIRSGNYQHVPLMIGFTSLEAIFICTPNLQTFPCQVVEDHALLSHQLGYKVGTKEHDDIGNKVKQFYFGNTDQERSLYSLEATTLGSDNFFTVELTAATRAHAKNLKEPVYSYLFSAVTDLEMVPTRYGGVSHCNELPLLFKSFESKWTVTPGSIEDITVRRIVKLWTNFAKTGDPNSQNNDDLIQTVWEPTDPKRWNYLNIGTELTVEEKVFDERVEFWIEIYKNSPNGSIYFD